MPRYVSAPVIGCGLGFLSNPSAQRGQGIQAYKWTREFRIPWKWRALAWQRESEQILLVLSTYMAPISLCLFCCLTLCLIFAHTRGFAAFHYTVPSICFPSPSLASCPPMEFEITLLIGVWGWGLVAGGDRRAVELRTWVSPMAALVTNVLSDCH